MMDVDSKLAINMCRTLLRPIASLLMKCGLTWREFANVSKSVFVQVASADYGIGGRPTNISRVSLLTGISRKEVKRQRELLEQVETAPAINSTDATRLLSAWHQDAEFSDGEGRPRPLSDTQFENLYARYGGDIPASAIIKELQRVGAIERDAGGKLLATSRYYMPTQFDPEWIRNAGSYFEDLGSSINYNLSAKPEQATRFVGRASDPHIDPAAVGEFYAFMERQGQQFLEEVDDWLARHPADASHGVRLGVGLFLIDNKTTG